MKTGDLISIYLYLAMHCTNKYPLIWALSIFFKLIESIGETEKQRHKGQDGTTKIETGPKSLLATSTQWDAYVMLIGFGTVAVLIANDISRQLQLSCSSRWLSAVFLTPQPSPCKLVAETDHH